MRYVLEIYYNGQCIEQRGQDEPFIWPQVGDRVWLYFQNTNYSEEYGPWWIVRARTVLLGDAVDKANTLQLFCEPDPAGGR